MCIIIFFFFSPLCMCLVWMHTLPYHLRTWQHAWLAPAHCKTSFSLPHPSFPFSYQEESLYLWEWGDGQDIAGLLHWHAALQCSPRALSYGMRGKRKEKRQTGEERITIQCNGNAWLLCLVILHCLPVAAAHRGSEV